MIYLKAGISGTTILKFIIAKKVTLIMRLSALLLTAGIVVVSALSFLSPCAAAEPSAAVKPSTKPHRHSKTVLRLIKEEKLDEARGKITEWQSEAPDDADLAVAKANLLIAAQAAQSHMVINQFDKGSKSAPSNVHVALDILDPETSEVVGYIGREKPGAGTTVSREALKILKEAVTTHPDRLDIRLGIVQLHVLDENYESVLSGLVEALDYASSKDYKGLLSALNEPAEEPKQSLADNLHRYYLQYTRETDSPDDQVAFQYAEAMTKYFPEDIRGWNDLCAEYTQKGDHSKAVEALKKAHELNKNDTIVLMNMGHLYKLMEKPAEAIGAYEKILELKEPNPDLKEDARAELEKLKSQQ